MNLLKLFRARSLALIVYNIFEVALTTIDSIHNEKPVSQGL